MNKILVVDDELSIRESFSLILEGKYQVLTVATGEGALKQVADQKIDLLYLDVRMPGFDGLETLERIKKIDPRVDVVMVTAVNDVQKASEAIKLGARDYIIKPFDVQTIMRMTETILRKKSLLVEGEALQKEAQKETSALVGLSEKIETLLTTIKKIAPTNKRVLVLGEPGTERATVAHLLHEHSSRAGFPLRPLCLSGKMAPAEIKVRLFGLSSGQTTADLKRKAGLVEELRGGSLFIDHAEFLPPDLIPPDVRLISGSSLFDLAEKNKALYDLLAEELVIVPPLRTRTSDIPLLVKYFMEKWNLRYNKDVRDFTPEALEILTNYAWPGNTDELNSVIRRIILKAAAHVVTAGDLPLDLLIKSGKPYGADYLPLFEKEYLHAVDRELGGDKEALGALLNIPAAVLERNF